jgi:hypothetical protein
MTTPELERPQGVPPEGATETPPPSEVPAQIEQGVPTTPQQQIQQVMQDQSQTPAPAPAANVVTITIPADPQQLADWSKGEPSESLTWYATFWIRMIKKAIHFGWRVVTGQQQQQISHA